MLEARGLACAHPGASPSAAAAIGPLDLTAAAGDWLRVVGGNGSGKTALLLTLAGLVPPRAGDVRIDGGPPRARPHDVAIVFQEPETQFVTDRVARELAFPLESQGWERAAIVARVAELLATFDLGGLADAPPARLSGGEMQRVALATALAPRPRHLLLDEPTAYLDRASSAAFLAHVRSLVTAREVAVVQAACSDDECPEATRALALPASAPADAAAAIPAVERAAHPPPAFAPALAGATAPLRGEVLWRARDLALRPGGARAARPAPTEPEPGLEFEIRAGEAWLVSGPNGSGKTSLLDALAGWRRPSAGTLESFVSKQGSVALGYVGQFPEYQLFAATALEDVAFGPRSRRTSRNGDTSAVVRAAFERVGLDYDVIGPRAPESLSLGERRRLALAGALASQPSILLLDEPTVGLDPEARRGLLDTLEALRRRGVTLVVASHDPDPGLAAGFRRLALGERRMVEDTSRKGPKSP